MADALLTTDVNIEDTGTPDQGGNPQPEQGGEGTPENKDAQGDNNQEESANQEEQVPYEIKVPDGVEFDAEHVTAFTEFAKNDLKLPADQAQKLMEWYGKTVQASHKSIESAWRDTNEGWIKSAKEDKEFGGDKFDSNLTIAKQALKKFGSPELIEALNITGFGNHPAALKFFFKVAKATGEDKLELGNAHVSKEMSVADILFPSTSK